MDEPGAQNLIRSTADWVDWLEKYFTPAGLNAAGIRSFLNHFADLGIFSEKGEGLWVLSHPAGGEPIQSELRHRLEALSKKDEGFAVAYFIGQGERDIQEVLAQAAKPGKEDAEKTRNSRTVPTSDRSNFEIVKKIGRQLQPFLQLEESIVQRLQGTHTHKSDAQRIFRFLLSRTQAKAKARSWEQLSRKRHR
jgi:hypothetical protein